MNVGQLELEFIAWILSKSINLFSWRLGQASSTSSHLMRSVEEILGLCINRRFNFLQSNMKWSNDVLYLGNKIPVYLLSFNTWKSDLGSAFPWSPALSRSCNRLSSCILSVLYQAMSTATTMTPEEIQALDLYLSITPTFRYISRELSRNISWNQLEHAHWSIECYAVAATILLTWELSECVPFPLCSAMIDRNSPYYSSRGTSVIDENCYSCSTVTG